MIEYILNAKVLLIFVVLYILYKFGKLNQNLHLKVGHKGPPPLPYIGNFYHLFKKGLHEFDKMCYKKYGKIYPFYFGSINICMVADEELLKQILIKESKCFTDRLDIGFQREETKKMLTVLKGKDWERVRNLITPTFTSGKLKKMSPLISDAVQLLEERITSYSDDKPIDFKEFFGALTMDVIARTMFGMHIDSQTNPDNLFIVNAKKLFNFSFFNPLVAIFLIFPNFSRLLRKIFPNGLVRARETFKFFNTNLKKAIDERQKSSEKYNDFLALMLKAQKEVDENDSDQLKSLDSRSLTIQEIMAQSLIFLLAGYETTATTLTYIAYFLAKYPKAQQEVYDEMMDTIGNEEDISYEELMNLPLLDAAINETLRICPPAVRIDRSCTQDVVLTASDNSKIYARKGDVFAVPIYAIHTDPALWPNPETFDLHRFDPENKKNVSQYSFMPFGMGPRNCVGMRFALLEVKWAMVNIMRKFEIIPCSETPEIIKFKKSGLSAPTEPIILKVVKRN